MQKILENYHTIKAQTPSNVTITVVTKKNTIYKIKPLIQAGHTNFAENYIQEAKQKWKTILQNPNNHNINLKLIGKLQSNKINESLKLFHEIHSIHSIELAHKIAQKINKNT